MGAHFRIDALASFFLFVVNLGGALTSLYGLGYGRHEPHPARVLPFFPAFLAGMNLVVLAHDASCYIDWIQPDLLPFLPNWNFLHIHEDVVPALLERGVTQEQVDQMLVGNPRDWFERT